MSRGLIVPVKPDGTPYASQSVAAKALPDVDVAALWKASNAKASPGQVRLFYGQGQDKATTVALVGVGKVDGLSAVQLSERSRIVAATGVKALREVGCTNVRLPLL
jgi:hypothetical protein